MRQPHGSQILFRIPLVGPPVAPSLVYLSTSTGLELPPHPPTFVTRGTQRRRSLDLPAAVRDAVHAAVFYYWSKRRVRMSGYSQDVLRAGSESAGCGRPIWRPTGPPHPSFQYSKCDRMLTPVGIQKITFAQSM